MAVSRDVSKFISKLRESMNIEIAHESQNTLDVFPCEENLTSLNPSASQNGVPIYLGVSVYFRDFIVQYFAIMSSVCLLFVPKWWKQILPPVILLWRKSLTSTAISFQRKWGKHFSTEARVSPAGSEEHRRYRISIILKFPRLPGPHGVFLHFLLTFPSLSILSDELTDFFFFYFDGGNLLPSITGMRVVIRFPVCKMPYLPYDTTSTHVDVSICTLNSYMNIGLLDLLFNKKFLLCNLPKGRVPARHFVALKHKHVTRNTTQ